MKKTLYTILVASLLTACYEDKGNYDYALDQMNEITNVRFTPGAVETIDGKTIEVQQPLSENDRVKRIEVSMDQSLASNIDNLDFIWTRTYINEEGLRVKDSLYTPGYMEVELPVGKEMRYDVLLEIKDKTTTLSNYTNFVIKTRPIYKNSLFVLHGSQGARKLGNIEVVGADTKVRMDAYQTVYPEGSDMFNHAIALSYSTYYDLYYMKESNNLSVYTSDGRAHVFEPFGLTYKFNPNFVVPSGVTDFVFSRNVEAGDPGNYRFYRCVLSRNGAFYTGNYIPKLYKPYAQMDAYPEYADPNHQSDYQVTAVAITEQRFVMWDAKNNRFLYLSKSDGYANDEYNTQNPWLALSQPVLDAYVDFSHMPAEVSPVGKKAVYAYINYRENYEEAHPFFIFKDEATGKFYQYELTSLQTGDGKGDGKSVKGKDDGKEEGNEPAFSISYKEMRNFQPGENLALICYNSYFTTNYIFYADGANVYRYNISNGDKNLIYTAPVGYTIGVMKFRTNSANIYNDDLGYILSLGLNKGSEGAVAEIKLNTASDLDEEFEPLFYNQSEDGEKFGNIQDLQFAHVYMYKI